MYKKRVFAVAVLCGALALGTGCGGKSGPSQSAAEEQTQELSTEAVKKEETKASDTAENTMTGTIEENKGFMMTVISETDKEAYVFPIEDQAATEQLKAGDKVIITYEGDPSPDSEYVKVISVKAA